MAHRQAADDDLVVGNAELAAHHAERGQEVFLAPAVRSAPRGEK